MHKRKRFEVSTAEDHGDGILDRVVRSQRQQLETFIEYGKKNLFRSLKLARGFERQKLGRRQKTAKEKHDHAETARLEAEVAALKALDLASTAEVHLYKSLLKSKPILTSPALPASVISILDSSTQTHDVAHANVTARLFNSNPVRTAMSEVMTSINAVLGIEQQPNRKKRLRKADYEGNRPTRDEAKSEKEGIRTLQKATDDEDASDWGGISGSEEQQGVKQDGSEDESEDESDHEYDRYASRLAASSDSESSGSESEPVHPSGAQRIARDLSLSPSPSPPDSLSPPSPPSSKIKGTKSSSTAPKTTTFLPSLMVGGYWSGSESASELDEKADSTDIKPRKNRMGQQARRALWEKKFGAKANHLKGQPRESNWDARRGASGADERGKRGRGRGDGGRGGGMWGQLSGGRGGASGANSDPVKVRKEKVKEGPLHPSWEAAKKAKEQKKEATFQGKKMVFND